MFKIKTKILALPSIRLDPKPGFTLIELLVVIAIIGIVMSIGVANFVTAQKQARDANRKTIIRNVQTALEQYYASTGSYPLIAADAFEGSAPTDPREDLTPLSYDYLTDSGYCVCATLEGGGGNANAPSSTVCNWADDGDYYCAQSQQ